MSPARHGSIWMLLLAACLARTAAGQDVLVDDLEDLAADGTSVTSRVLGGVTISISTAAGSMTARTYFDEVHWAFVGAGDVSNAPLSPENVSGNRFMSTSVALEDWFAQHQPIVFEFSQPVDSFGLTTVDLLEDDTAQPASLTLRAYGVDGGVVDEQTRTGEQGPNGLDLDWVVSSPGHDIVRVELTGTIPDSAGYGIDDLLIGVDPLGATYCTPANPNSTGRPAFLLAAGSAVILENDVTFVTAALPINQYGYYLTSRERDFLPLFGGSEGNLCLGAPIVRFAG